MVWLKENQEFYKFIQEFRTNNIGNIWEAKSWYLDGLFQTVVYPYSRASGGESFSLARELYNKFLGTKEFSENDLIDLDIQLADKLEYTINRYYYWQEREYNADLELKMLKESEEKSLQKEVGKYLSEWDARKKVVYLYRELLNLFKKDQKNYFTTLYDFGNYLRRVARTEIYQNESLKVLEEVISKAPDIELKAKAQYILAIVNENKGDYLKALDEYQKIIDRYGKSNWVNDAKSHIQEIKKPYLSMQLRNQFMITDTVKFEVSTKNVPQVNFAIYQIDFSDILESKWKSKKVDINSFEGLFGDSKSLLKAAGKKVFEWDVKIDDKKDYKYVNTPIQIPDRIIDGKVGQYVIVASYNNLFASGLVVITDLIMVERSEGGKVHCFITDAISGKPARDVNIFFRYSSYYEDIKFDYGKTDENGLCVETTKGTNYYNVATFAYKNKSFVATNDFYLNQYGRKGKAFTKYTITDRPVYRPNQTVYFKHIIKTEDNGIYKPIINKDVIVLIRDAKYQEVYKQTLKTNEFGSVYGEYKIPDGAPLGVYNFLIKVVDVDQYEDYVQSFRVEEYKRPEVQVKIEPISEKLKIGNNLKVKIHAEYYFGGPVPDAEVQYTVKRSKYRQFFYTTNDYDWLYGKGFSEDRRWNYYWWYYDAQETLIDNKTVKTDAEGNVLLNYETESLLKEDWKDDYRYVIQVKVTDASRRVIDDTKSIVVSRREFNVFIKNERGFIRTNEKAKFNIYAVTSNYAPKEVTGKISIYRLIPLKEQTELEIKYKEEKVQENNISLEKGNANYTWQALDAGLYKIVFETKDADNEPVSNELKFWVVDNSFTGKSFYYKNIEIISEKEVYKEGETVNLLINTNKPGSYVWLSYEGDNNIIKSEVVYIEGKSKITSFKLNKQYVPNFFINAFVIGDGECYTDNKQIFVPPESQLLTVEVKPDKETYKPGERAKFLITTKNFKGEPVQSEVSLSVVDASIFYIQNILIPDIRKFYYGYLRSNNIVTINSLSYTMNTHSDNYNKYNQYETHGYPDGWNRMSRFLRFHDDLAEGIADEEKYGETTNAKKVMGVERPSTEAAPIVAADHVKAKKDGGADGEASGAGEGEIKIRENFNETVYWNPVILTDKNGKAEIEFDFNDALTQWHVAAKSITTSSEVGETSIEVRTKKELLVRLQAPRFFQEKDEVVISANVHNYSSKPKNIKVTLDLEGGTLEFLKSQKNQEIRVDVNGEKRVDWRTKVIKPGKATLIVKAITPDDNDAVKMEFPVLEYGIEKFIAINGELKKKNEEIFEIKIPEEIRLKSQSVEFTVSPSLATIALSALPYLINYPYGCFEQTVNRFVPAVVVAKTISDLGIDLSEIKEYNQKINANLLPYWSPVYSKMELNKVINECLKRIYNFQNGNGGFSWWPGFDSDPYMTSLGIVSLCDAKKAGIDVRINVIENAVNFLTNYVNTHEGINDNTKTYMYYAISCYKPENVDQKGLNELFKIRDHLTWYSYALMGLAYENIVLKEIGKFQLASLDHPLKDERSLIEMDLTTNVFKNMVILRENLLDRVRIDKENNTAFWNPESPYYWWWYNDRIETTTMILKFLNHVDPKNEVLGKVVKWLVNNRRGGVWYSTKDTGLAIAVLMEYIRLNHELDVDYSIQILIDDKKIKDFKVNKDNVFTFTNNLKLSADEIGTGKHKIKIIKEGKGNLYYSTFIKYFTREDSITAAGNEISIARSYFKLVPVENDVNGKKLLNYKEVPIKFGEQLKSGDEIRVKLDIDSKNDYEYLVFEDLKPSGCEFKMLKSWGGYMELRDTKVVFFISWLRQGKNYVQYDMRAEIPGVFHVMPTNGYAMYTPDIRGISDAFKISILDK
jgi:hypothetical protein